MGNKDVLSLRHQVKNGLFQIAISLNDIYKKETFSFFKMSFPVTTAVTVLLTNLVEHRGDSIWVQIKNAIFVAAMLYLLALFIWSIANAHVNHANNYGADVDLKSQTAIKVENDYIVLDPTIGGQSKFTWVSTEELLTEVDNLFDEAYIGKHFGKDPSTTKKRNKSHYDCSKSSFLLIPNVDNNRENKSGYAGYTHVVAVNADVWNRYKSGDLTDEKFSGRQIIPERRMYSDQTPFGLIIQTAASPSRKRNKKEIGEQVAQAVAFHLDHYCNELFFNAAFIPVMFETMNWNVTDFFSKSRTNNRNNTRNGAEIICFDLKNNHAANIKTGEQTD